MSPSPTDIAGLIETGQDFHRRGWSLGTSSNYSVTLSRDPLRLLLTGSGFDKGRLTPEQFVVVNALSLPVGIGSPKPSAETALHVTLAREADAGSVLHTHSVWGTLLSEAYLDRGHIGIGGYEMLKGLSGITTHETEVKIAIFPNTQDIPALAHELAARLHDPATPLRHGFLIAGHGLYAWGKDLAEARRHIEVLEFLFEVIGRKNRLHGAL